MYTDTYLFVNSSHYIAQAITLPYRYIHRHVNVSQFIMSKDLLHVHFNVITNDLLCFDTQYTMYFKTQFINDCQVISISFS